MMLQFPFNVFSLSDDALKAVVKDMLKFYRWAVEDLFKSHWREMLFTAALIAFLYVGVYIFGSR